MISGMRRPSVVSWHRAVPRATPDIPGRAYRPGRGVPQLNGSIARIRRSSRRWSGRGARPLPKRNDRAQRRVVLLAHRGSLRGGRVHAYRRANVPFERISGRDLCPERRGEFMKRARITYLIALPAAVLVLAGAAYATASANAGTGRSAADQVRTAERTLLRASLDADTHTAGALLGADLQLIDPTGGAGDACGRSGRHRRRNRFRDPQADRADQRARARRQRGRPPQAEVQGGRLRPDGPA